MQSYLPIINFALTSILTGLIWTIQRVHYPSFHWVARNKFNEFIDFHGRRISQVVIPLMLAELAAAVAFAWLHQQALVQLAYANLFGVLAIWGITFAISAPTHGKLANGYDSDLVDWLIVSNWMRTVLWTARTILLLFCLGL